MKNIFKLDYKYLFRQAKEKIKQFECNTLSPMLHGDFRFYTLHSPKKWINKHPNKTFYIIWRDNALAGFFSNVYVFLSQIEYALKKGYTPVIDMQNFENNYITKEELHKVNAWTFYYKQPAGYDLSDAYFSKHFLFSDGNLVEGDIFSLNNYSWLEDEEKYTYWLNIFNQYMPFNEKTKTYIESTHKALFPANERILGMHCRGTDYNTMALPGHAKQATPEMIIDKAEEMMAKYACTKVFIATEDEGIFTQVKQHFGARLIHMSNRRVSSNSKLPAVYAFYEMEESNYTLGLQYITEIALLAKCDCYITGMVSSAPFVMLMNKKKFSAYHIWNLGIN